MRDFSYSCLGGNGGQEAIETPAGIGGLQGLLPLLTLIGDLQ